MHSTISFYTFLGYLLCVVTVLIEFQNDFFYFKNTVGVEIINNFIIVLCYRPSIDVK